MSDFCEDGLRLFANKTTITKRAFHKPSAFCETAYTTSLVQPHHVQAAAPRRRSIMQLALLTTQLICAAFSQSYFYKFLMSNGFELRKSVDKKWGLWTVLWMLLSPVDLQIRIQIVTLAVAGSSSVGHPILSTPVRSYTKS